MFGLFSKKKRVYLDNAGATEMSNAAQAELARLLPLYGNPSAIHKEGAFAGKALDKARRDVARLLNAHAYEITFVSGGTESCNLAILGTYEAWKKNNERVPHVITSQIEHPAVLEPIKHLEHEGKIKATYLPVYEDGVIKVSDLREALNEDTILVSVMYANNEIGSLQPVKEIGRVIEEWKRERNLTHTAYPYFHTDACQAGNYFSLDVLRLRAHLMSVNGSKVYGPKGVGLLYRREGCALSPLFHGGGQERNMRSGTESVALASSFAVALTESQEIKDKESIRVAELRDWLKDELTKNLPQIIFYGAFDAIKQGKDGMYREWKRLPNNLNFRVPGIESEEMILRLDAKGFAVSHKSACASQEDDGSYVIMALGGSIKEAKENIRVTLGRYTTKKDLVSFVEAVVDITKKYSPH